VRLVTATDAGFGPGERGLGLARRISAVARELGLVADAEGNEVDVAPGWSTT
jgi:hypothetical protein